MACFRYTCLLVTVRRVRAKRGGVALDEALSIIQRCSVKSEVLRVLLLDFSFFSLGVEVKHRANTNSFPVFQKDKSAWTSFLHQTAGSDLFFFSCRVKKFCCFTRTEVRFLNVVWSGKPEGRHISLSLSRSAVFHWGETERGLNDFPRKNRTTI